MNRNPQRRALPWLLVPLSLSLAVSACSQGSSPKQEQPTVTTPGATVDEDGNVTTPKANG